MTREFLKTSYFLQELEEANGKILCDLLLIARLANISLGIMTKAVPRHDEDVELYFHTRRTIERLQKESFRQAQLLSALKDELIHGKDGERSAVPPCVLFDYEKEAV
ncbi:MAG: hypothetical protein QME88_02810 [Actinomycetota bacterium]|nr:hypothetical protein [Actinomycetota bacterium]